MTALKDDAVSAGVIAYNGFTFPNPRNVKVRGTPVYDEAGRAVIYVAYTLSVHTIVWASASSAAPVADTANYLENLRTRLFKPGQSLTLTNIGFGDLSLNSVDEDVAWGPKPRVCEFEPIAGLAAWDLNWTVEFSLPECGSLHSPAALLALNYEIVYSSNERGFSTRTVSGYAELPRTRNADGGRLSSNSTDFVWDRINVTLPPGFIRKTNQRRVSKDKRRLDFVIVDEELMSLPWPAGIVGGDIEYGVENVNIGFAQHVGSLSGSLETAPDKPVSLAAQVFVNIALAKIQELRASVGGNASVIVQKLRLQRGLFSRRSTFGASFLVTGTIGSMLGKSGVWTPVAGTDYQQWAASMKALWSGRGKAGLRSGVNDVIIDICGGATGFTIDDGGGSQEPPPYEPTVTFDCNVTSANSWLAYENAVRGNRSQEVAVHKYAQPYQNATASMSGVSLGPSTTGLPDVIQYQSLPSDRVLLVGRALRIDFVPDVPALVSVQGQAAIEIDRNVEVKKVADFLGCKLYFARWSILYRLASPGSQLTPPDNPVIDKGKQ